MNSIVDLLNITREQKLNGIWLDEDYNLYFGWDNMPDNFTGEYKNWYKNKQLYKYCLYKNGKLEGEYKIWWDDGQLYEYCFFKNGEWDGEYKLWNYSGKLYDHSLYKNGVIIKDYLK